MKYLGASEYEGQGTEESGQFDKPKSAMSNGERLQLSNLTGQEEDATAPLNPAHWRGAREYDGPPINPDFQNFAG